MCQSLAAMLEACSMVDGLEDKFLVPALSQSTWPVRRRRCGGPASASSQVDWGVRAAVPTVAASIADFGGTRLPAIGRARPGCHRRRLYFRRAGGSSRRRALARGRCDLIVGFLTTYMTSTKLVPVAQRSGAPMGLLNLQPTEAMDHANVGTGQWLAYCRACPLPEMATDLTFVSAQLGGHVEVLEIDELRVRVEAAGGADVCIVYRVCPGGSGPGRLRRHGGSAVGRDRLRSA